jgi:hypothetical protein
MEENEFTGFSIPDGIADPEEREFLELVSRIIVLASKKCYTLSLMARIDEKDDVIAIMGCGHCIEYLLCKTMEEKPKFRGLLLRALVEITTKDMTDKQDAAEQLINHARKNTPAGN